MLRPEPPTWLKKSKQNHRPQTGGIESSFPSSSPSSLLQQHTEIKRPMTVHPPKTWSPPSPWRTQQSVRRSYSNTTAETIQVVQKTSNTMTEAHTCQVVMNRHVCRCEFFTSSQFGCTPSMIEFQLPVTKEQLQQIATTHSELNCGFEHGNAKRTDFWVCSFWYHKMVVNTSNFSNSTPKVLYHVHK